MRNRVSLLSRIAVLSLLLTSCTGGEYNARESLISADNAAGQPSQGGTGSATSESPFGGAANPTSSTSVTAAGTTNHGEAAGGAVAAGSGGCATPVRYRTPLVTDLYTADPSARIFDGRIYIYPSHDVDPTTLVEAGTNSASLGDSILSTTTTESVEGAQYAMTDYHVYSLDNMVCSPVTDHGKVLQVQDVPWASRQMWAPDAIKKDDTYYLYFPARDKSDLFRIGVATSKTPTGPFIPQAEPIAGSFSIDPAVLADDDGQAYLYFGGLMGGQLEHWQSGSYDPNVAEPAGQAAALGPRVAKLRSDMLGFDGSVSEIRILDEVGAPLVAADVSRNFFEGVWVHKYQGTYYLSYSTGTTHYLAWASSNNPLGPFTYRGKLLEPVSGWTTHHSILEWNGKWYLFYHDSSLSGRDNERNMKVMEFARTADGGLPTLLP